MTQVTFKFENGSTAIVEYPDIVVDTKVSVQLVWKW